jgi:hypothetical protein
MSTPQSAASRALTRADGVVVRVSQPWPARSWIRSPNKQLACAGCRRTSDSHYGPNNGHRITCRRRSRLSPSVSLPHLLTFTS